MTKANDPGNADGSEPVGDHVRIFRRGRMWYANFQAHGKQQRQSLKTTSKKQARLRAIAIDTEIAKGTWRAAPTTATVAQGVAAYLAYLRTEARAAKTLGKYNMVFDRVAELAQKRGVSDLSGIDLRFVDEYRSQRAGNGAAAKTLYGETTIIKQLINFGLSRDMLATDPLKGLRLKKPKPTPQPCWTYEHVVAILAAAPDDVRPALTLLAETGMRFGELAWLTWEDVAPRTLHIRAKPGWKPKSGDQRAIPRSKVVDATLALLPKRSPWVVTMPPTTQSPDGGRQWTERRLLAALKRVLKSLGLIGKLHTFRHFFISNALERGTPEAVVREWVGHVDDEIMRLYTHVHSDASQRAMRKLTEANLDRDDGPDRRDVAGGDSAQNKHSNTESSDGTDAK